MATVDNVIQYYEAILRREPTDSQKALWVAQLDSAGGSAAAYEDFAASLLLQATEVRSIIRLYQAIFDRVPDGLEANGDTGGGLTYWTNVFRDFRADHPELSYKDALIYSIQDWLNSDEYTNNYGANLSDEDFLSTLYVNILGRPPEQEGFDYWLGRLQDANDPITREQLVIEFTESQEFKNDVNDEANDLLHTAARIASDTTADDISYEVPGDNVYQGELANEAPTDIIHSTDVNENAVAGTKVAGADPLVAVDMDGEESFTWSINDPSGNFAMSGANIVVAAGADLNYEDTTSYVVTVTVTDKAGNSYSEDITIDINDVADQTDAIAAAVTPTAETAANGTAVATLTASEDGTTLAGVTFTLSDDAGGRFEVVGNQIRVKDTSLIDHETATAHTVTVESSDGFSRDVTISITDVADDVDQITDTAAPINENAANETVVGTLTGLETDLGAVVPNAQFTLVDDAGGRFKLVGNEIRVANGSLLDHETATSHTITVESNGVQHDVTINLNDLADKADDLTLAGGAIDEDATAGVVVGTLDAIETDTGSIAGAGFSIVNDTSGGKFVIVGNQIQVAAGATFDHETNDTYQVTVKSDTSAYQETFTININDINEAPTNIQPTVAAVDEEAAALTEVATLTVDDQDDGDTHTWTITNSTVPGAFDILGNKLVVADGSLIDYDAGVTSVDVEVEATDSGGLTTTRTITVAINDLIDELPTDIQPDNANTAAASAPGSLVAALTAIDADVNDHFTFTLDFDGLGADAPQRAFGIQGSQLVLLNPTLVDSNNLPDGEVTIGIRVTDGAGNTYDDTIVVTVDQTGQIIALTDQVEVSTGGEGDDLFTANAGYGEDAFFPNAPGDGQTAQAGDIIRGEGGQNTFVLTKQENNTGDGDSIVTGVITEDIQNLVLINRDDVGPNDDLADPIIDTDELCAPCIDIPDLAPTFSEALIFEATESADIDFVAFVQSVNSVGVYDLQPDFWTNGGEVDRGPIVNIDDVTADFVHVDSDIQSKTAGNPIDNLIFTVDEVRINDLRITENAAGNVPGGPRGEQVGTLTIIGADPGDIDVDDNGQPTLVDDASVVPSIIGSINNGTAADGFASGAWTHTLDIMVTDITGSRPGLFGTNTPAGALAGVDMSIGHLDGIGSGLVGIEHVNINGQGAGGADGDVFMVFDHDGIDVDGNGFSLEVMGGAGQEILFFEEGTFGYPAGPAVPGATNRTYVNGGDNTDTIGLFAEDLNGNGQVINVENLKVLETVGGSDAKDTYDPEKLFLGAFDNNLEHVMLSDGVEGDLEIIDIPDHPGTTDQAELKCADPDFGEPGVVIEIMQCCFDLDDQNPPRPGHLPNDFDLYLDAVGSAARIDTIFHVDPGPITQSTDDTVTVENLIVNDVSTFHLNVSDCEPGTAQNPDEGIFEIRYFGSEDQALQTLLLSDNGVGGITKVLQDTNADDDLGKDEIENPIGSGNFIPDTNEGTPNLTLVNGRGGTRGQQLAETTGAFMFLPVLEAWGADPTSQQRPADDGYGTAGFINELVVSADGATFNMGNGDDIAVGNRFADGVSLADKGDGLGADLFDLAAGNDLAFGNGGNDVFDGGSGNDELHGGDEDENVPENGDVMWGGTGSDLIFGNAGHDYIDGEADNDVAFGGTGEDYMLGGTGDDVLCGGDDDDCLFGEEGSDLLVGGQGDDFVDAGNSGVDALVGDYGCEPQYAVIDIHQDGEDPVEKFDVFKITIEGDELTVGVGTSGEDKDLAANADADAVANAFKTLIQNWINNLPAEEKPLWMVSVDNGDVITICKVDDSPLSVTYEATDAAEVAKTYAELDGQIGDGDQFKWEIEWNGGANSGTYTYTYDPADLGGDVSNDGLVDTIGELAALAQVIADDFNANAPNPLKALFKMSVDPATGNICLEGPDDNTGNSPSSVVVTATDGTTDEIPATFGREVIDIADGQTFAEGDRVTLSYDWDLDGDPDLWDEIVLADQGQGAPGIDASDVAFQLMGVINQNVSATHVTATLDPNDATKIVVTADVAGVTGDFNLDLIGAAESSLVIARTSDLTGEFDDQPAAGESLRITIDDDDSPAISYSIGWDTNLATSLADFVTTHQAAILANHGVTVRVNAGGDRLEFVDTGQNNADTGLSFTADINGTGVAFIENVGTTEVPDQVKSWTLNVNAGQTLEVTVDGVVLTQAHNGTTINSFITNHGATLASYGINVQNLGSGVIEFTDSVPILNGYLPGLTVAVTGGGSATPNQDTTTDYVPGSITENVVAENSQDDDTQSLTYADQEAGKAPQAVNVSDNLVVTPATVAGQDVFVAGSLTVNAAAYADGFDNDHMPNTDFYGLLAGAGLVGDGSNGGDGGVDGVVYVLDYNQGGGGDDLSTYDVNEAYKPSENTNGPDGRFYEQIQNADNDPARLTGDKLAFRKLDGTLDDCGNATNYDEDENTSASRDDADADAFSAFNSNADLRYYVNARTFEDSLEDNFNLQWGIDVVQQDVEDALNAIEGGNGGLDSNIGDYTYAELVGVMDAAKADSWLRVYYNDADSVDAAPERVMELVGLDSKSQIHYEDIVGSDCIDDCWQPELVRADYDFC